MADSPDQYTVDLHEYISVARARKWSIILTTAVVVASAMFFSFQQTPQYRAEARVLVKNPVSISGIPQAPPSMPTEAEVVDSEPVAAIVKEDLGLTLETSALLSGLTAEPTLDSQVMRLSFVSTDPVLAQSAVNSFADAYLKYRRTQALEAFTAAEDAVQAQIGKVQDRLEELEIDLQQAQEDDDTSQAATLQVQRGTLIARLGILQQKLDDIQPETATQLGAGEVIEAANLPAAPFSPNHIRNGLLALFLGLALGTGFAFLRERLDDRLRTPQEVAELIGAPLLAVIPKLDDWKRDEAPQLATIEDPRGAVSEAYRTLRTSLLFTAMQRGAKTILFTSVRDGEGKTTTVANLAVVLAQAGKRVVVVGGDLRRPRLHRFFKIHDKPGLTEFLRGQATLRDTVRGVPASVPGSSNLRAIPSGATPDTPSELLGSPTMARALRELGDICDIVLIDATPVLAVTDAVTLASICDAAVMVTDASAAGRRGLTQAIHQLHQVRADIIGTVVNNHDDDRQGYSGYYYGRPYSEEAQPNVSDSA